MAIDMTWLTGILRLLSGLTGLTSATTRLVEAVKDTEPPPPPIGQDGAEEFLRGQNKVLHQTWLTGDIHDRLERDEKPESEEPTT